jgi:FkbH-like protein
MSDRFGDLGIIATALLTFNERAMIDSFLMSCRVIGRGVESAVLAYLAKVASQRGCRELYGSFVPTKKNEPARDVYVRHGFETLGRDGNTEIFVLRDLTDSSIGVPEYITVKEGACDRQNP